MIEPHHRQSVTILCLSAALALAVGPACVKKPNPESNAAAVSADSTAKIDEILQRYELAVGGREAIDRIVSYHGKGSFSTSASPLTGTYEVWGKDPDKTLATITLASVVIKKGFDGTTRWVQTPVGTFVDESSSGMAEVERDADIYRAGKIKSLYDKMLMQPKARLHGRDVYVIEGQPVRGPSEKLFFDVNEGLLLRWDMVRKNPKRGNIFVKVHLEDYREVDGVRVPFKVRFAFESFDVTLTMDELKHNVDIADKFFKKPGS